MPYGGIGPISSSDAGHNLALTDTNAHAFGSQVTANGEAIFSARDTNTAVVYLARGSGVAITTGIPMLPGDSVKLPCQNTNEWFAITGTATQNMHAVAL